ncbi:MAG: PAS domain S-box protein [Kiritimatiellae bacterium]|nr:PAS domain S-box protein [Kiritimatiellia bacterium]
MSGSRTASRKLREREAIAAATAARSALDILNAMGEGVVLMRLDGTILSVNPAAERLTGLRQADVLGRPLEWVLPLLLEDDDLKAAQKMLPRLARGEVPALRPVILRQARGMAVHLDPAVTFIRTPDGHPVTAVLTLRDVTNLHETNELLKRVFDNTHVLIAYLDTDLRFVRVNAAYGRAGGHAPEYYVGKRHFDLYPNDENAAIFRRVIDTGHPYEVREKAFVYPDQPRRGITWWDWTLQPVKDRKGRVDGLLLCLLDVTEHRRARTALERNERRYRELVENASSIIMRVTRDHVVTFFNEYAQSLFGYSADEAVGSRLQGTIARERDAAGRDLCSMIAEIAAQPALHASGENECVCKDGRRVWIYWANRAIRDESGRVSEILCVGTDVTMRRRAETEAGRYRARLRELADRLSALEETERRRVSTHIHDTVVQSLSLASTRLGGLRDAVAAAGLSGACAGISGVRALLDDGLRECRRLMADLTPPLLYELGLGPALSEFAERMQRLHGTRIVVEEGGESGAMDNPLRGLLFQAARELVTNAVKHAGPCEIRVAVRNQPGQIRVQVEDNGRGFDPRTVDATDNAASGGFGLFNVRERLERLGGRLEIRSAPGEGTCAVVTVPSSTHGPRLP